MTENWRNTLYYGDNLDVLRRHVAKGGRGLTGHGPCGTQEKRQIMMTRKARWSFVLGAAAMLAFLPSCKDEAKEPLIYPVIHEAAEKGNLPDVKRHLARGVAVNAKDFDRYTPLHLAAREGHKEVVEYLVGKGADVNAKAPAWGRTPLGTAAERGHTDVVEILKRHGAKE